MSTIIGVAAAGAGGCGYIAMHTPPTSVCHN